MEEKISQIHQIFMEKKKENNSENTDSNEATSIFTDGQFEDSIRTKIEKTFNLSKIDDEKINKNKEFRFYEMELFDSKKKFIKFNDFDENAKFYYIQTGKEYFYIDKNDLSKLYYYDENDKKYLDIRGFEESLIYNNDNIKFYLIEDKPQNEEKTSDSNKKKLDVATKDIEEKQLSDSQETFLDEIKLNLISDKTFSYYGKNNNISKDYFQGYCIKGKLLSKGTTPSLISFGKEKYSKSKEGKYHYILDNYYVKLTSIKGQYDGAYQNQDIINLTDFKSRIIVKNFESIPINQNILFEFKNGIGGEKKVIKQAKRYQNTAKFILKEQQFYHIIIVAKRSLGDAILNYIGQNKSLIDNLNNFAIISLDDQYKIFGEELPISKPSLIDESKKGSKKAKSSRSSQSSKGSKINEEESNISLQSLLEYMKKNFNAINKSINDLKSSVEALQAQQKNQNNNNTSNL